MYAIVGAMGNIPVKTDGDRTIFLKDVASVENSSLPQNCIVCVQGKKQVYIPIYRQAGASTLDVVGDLTRELPGIQSRLTYGDIELKKVMDQSVYVRHSIWSLMFEG